MRVGSQFMSEAEAVSNLQELLGMVTEIVIGENRWLKPQSSRFLDHLDESVQLLRTQLFVVNGSEK